MRQRRDEADLLPRLLHPHIAGRAAGAFGKLRQCETLGQTGAQVLQRPVLVQPQLFPHLAHRHDLDEGQVVALPGTPVEEREQLLLIEAFQRDRVDLDADAGRLRGLDPLHHLREFAPAGDVLKLLRIERVERDVDPPDTAIRQFLREPLELRAIGGQRQFLQRAAVQMPRHGAEEGQDIAADQRFAPGDAQLFHPQPDEGRGQAVQFLKRQKILLGQELHMFRHAIGAAEVAAIGHRNPQVGDRTGKGVDQGCHGINLGPPRGGGKVGQGRRVTGILPLPSARRVSGGRHGRQERRAPGRGHASTAPAATMRWPSG